MQHIAKRNNILYKKTDVFAGTIAENIRWGKEEATLEEIKHACKVAQIDEYIEGLPDKYNSSNSLVVIKQISLGKS